MKRKLLFAEKKIPAKNSFKMFVRFFDSLYFFGIFLGQIHMHLLNPVLVHFFYHKPNSVLFHRLAFCWKVV